MTPETTLSSSLTDVNTKYSEKEIDLAVQGWAFATNSGRDDESIRTSKKYVIEKFNEVHPSALVNLEFRVEDTAYTTHHAVVLPQSKAVYMRGTYNITSYRYKKRGQDEVSTTTFAIKTRLPEEVVSEARDYLSKNEYDQLTFLLEVYNQIILGHGGHYAQRFKERSREIAAVLNYFADKLRGFDGTTEAAKLEAKVKDQFPLSYSSLFD